MTHCWKHGLEQYCFRLLTHTLVYSFRFTGRSVLLNGGGVKLVSVIITCKVDGERGRREGIEITLLKVYALPGGIGHSIGVFLI